MTEAAKRRIVRARAGRRCEYCRIHEDDEPYAFRLEHIIARKHGGSDRLANLAWSWTTNVVSSLALSADGKRLLSGSSDKTIKVWDLDAGEER